MKRFGIAAPVLLAAGLLALTACQSGQPRAVSPLAVDGPDGGSPVSYEGLMRIAAGAQSGGDFDTAAALFRRAAELNPGSTEPLVAGGNTLLAQGRINEAIVAFDSALSREPRNPQALRGVARAYLLTGRPELAGAPLAIALEVSPDDPKLLQLVGVAADFAGRPEEAQARYRRGLELLPGDPGLSQNLALSLALTGNYGEAIAILGPVALAPTATPRERQTLALVHALQGDMRAAERVANIDLDPQSVRRTLAYYETLRRLTPEARARIVRAMSTSRPGNRPD